MESKVMVEVSLKGWKNPIFYDFLDLSNLPKLDHGKQGYGRSFP
jgi:hypothetical protein